MIRKQQVDKFLVLAAALMVCLSAASLLFPPLVAAMSPEDIGHVCYDNGGYSPGCQSGPWNGFYAPSDYCANTFGSCVYWGCTIETSDDFSCQNQNYTIDQDEATNCASAAFNACN